MFANAELRWESTRLTVAYDTSIETIENLKAEISSYINTNSREWLVFLKYRQNGVSECYLSCYFNRAYVLVLLDLLIL